MNRKLNVYLCGYKTGVLYENELSQLSFRYSSVDVSPLSVRLPARIEEYPHSNIYPFIENLVPEGDAFEILTRKHISGNKFFSFLEKYGGDCAGAIAFYESEPVKSKKKSLQEISPVILAHIIDKLPEDPLLTSLENSPRLSLAGAQSKFAVKKINNQYYRSDDEHPTTHIIKIANRHFPNLLINEFFCMRLAQIMQMEVPDIELKETLKRPYLEIKRYDRYLENENVLRIHQEDFCQALGIVSDKKYQAGGGASLRDCFKIIENFSENPLSDITRFIEWIIFSYLIGNTDAHAKNLSLLHTKTGIVLAPFYDLLSTEVYPEKIVDHGMAMLINGKGKYNSLKPEDFIAFFGQLGLNATNMIKSVKNKFSNITTIAEELRNTDEFLPAKKSVCDDILAIIKKRTNKLFN